MAYQPNIPLATDRLKDSQADINGNFQELNTYLNVNHTAIDGTADQGKHNMVTLVPQTPIPPTIPGQLNLFSRLDTVTGANQLYFTRDGVSAARMTGSIVNFAAPSTINGSIPISPGVFLKWFTHTEPLILANTTRNLILAYPTGGNIPPFNTATALALFTKIIVGSSFEQPYDIHWNTSSTDKDKIGIQFANQTSTDIVNAITLIVVIGY
jgi:hypothetical protein